MKTTLAIIFTVAFCATTISAQGRYVDPRQAAILNEARYLSGDGSFGAAYVQEDGVEFKEETDQDGNRKGQYSYIDPNGKKITVQYTAGKNGFQVSGDHLPKAPRPVVPPQPRAPVPQYNPQPQYNSISQPPRYNNPSNDDGQYRPELYETPYYNNNNNNNVPQARPQAPPAAHYSHVSGFNQQNRFQAPPTYASTTTPSPRFFPPGKLNLNRTPDGFQYTFSTQ